MATDEARSRLPVDPARWAENLVDRRVRHRQRPLAQRVPFAIAGVIVLVVGIFAIPLPGPGWVIVFVGLGMLALEFAWAERLALLVLAGLEWFWDRWLEAKRWQRGVALLGLLAITAFAVSLSATLIGSPDFVPQLW